jgi:hypothetical protein
VTFKHPESRKESMNRIQVITPLGAGLALATAGANAQTTTTTSTAHTLQPTAMTWTPVMPSPSGTLSTTETSRSVDAAGNTSQSRKTTYGSEDGAVSQSTSTTTITPVPHTSTTTDTTSPYSTTK